MKHLHKSCILSPSQETLFVPLPTGTRKVSKTGNEKLGCGSYGWKNVWIQCDIKPSNNYLHYSYYIDATDPTDVSSSVWEMYNAQHLPTIWLF